MTNIKLWGPSVWNLFHVLAEQIKPDKFIELSKQLFPIIIRICHNLPCPDCSMHAKMYLSKIIFSNIKTKDHFRHFVWKFHNTVNHRKKKALFDPALLTSTYGKKSLVECFNEFIKLYKTQGNMKLMADGFQRQMVVADLKKWIIQNLNFFEKTPSTTVEPTPVEPTPNVDNIQK